MGARALVRPRGRSAFTLIDTLVSISVIAVLIAILLPAMGSINELTRRVICASNQRQIGLGIAMYAQTYRGALPPSVLLRPGPGRPVAALDEMTTLRLASVSGNGAWDGLGHLFAAEYLQAPKVFYCPSNRRESSFLAQADRWLDQRVLLRGNFHYRGLGPNGVAYLSDIEPDEAVLVADALRVASDFNHEGGINVLRADLAVRWIPDPAGELQDLVPATGTESADERNRRVTRAWEWLDIRAGDGAPR